jgi:hypothetical protein
MISLKLFYDGNYFTQKQTEHKKNKKISLLLASHFLKVLNIKVFKYLSTLRKYYFSLNLEQPLQVFNCHL